MTSEDYSHEGFFGFMNMLKYPIKTHNIHLRPNFPPINPSPTSLEIFKNVNKADFGLIASITLAAIPISYLMVNQAFKELTDFSKLKDLYLLKSNCFRDLFRGSWYLILSSETLKHRVL